MRLKDLEPEFLSFEAFVDFLLEDDRLWPTPDELEELGFRFRISKLKVRNKLIELGCEPPKFRPKVSQARGFTANSHNRWESCPTHSTWSDGQIQGLAGAEKSSLQNQHKVTRSIK